MCSVANAFGLSRDAPCVNVEDGGRPSPPVAASSPIPDGPRYSSGAAADTQHTPPGASFEGCMNFLRSTRGAESRPGEFAEACAPYRQQTTTGR